MAPPVVQQSLKSVLKRLTLSGIVPTLPDRASFAKKANLSALEFLELALQDEIHRRRQKSLATRLSDAGFEEEETFEDFDWEAPMVRRGCMRS